MDLHAVERVRRPAFAEEIPSWDDGMAWLAGGTWLFSEPHPDVHTLIDLESMNWPALRPSEAGLEIASTCRVVELDRFADQAPQWTAAPLFRHCCRSFLSSFRIPAFADIPRSEVIFVETHDRHGPLGAKPIGEAAIIPVSAALGNALADATGLRFQSLPLSADRIFARLAELGVPGANLPGQAGGALRSPALKD